MRKTPCDGLPPQTDPGDRTTGTPREFAFLKRLTAALASIEECPLSGSPALKGGIWLALAFIASVVIFPGGWFYSQDFIGISATNGLFTTPGIELFNKLTPAAAAYMPLLSVISLWSHNGSFIEIQELWLLISIVVCVLGYSLGSRLSGRLGGVAASAALFSGQLYLNNFFDVEQRVCCLLLLLVANALAITGLSPWKQRLIEGCAIGITFLSRSVLCWFPLLLALIELKNAGKCGSKRILFRAFLVLVVPFLVVLPWVRFNVSVMRNFRVFDGRSDWNVATGAMGIVSTVEGDYRKLAGMERTENATFWAAKRIIAHPVTYASGVIKRIRFLFLMYPAAFLIWGVLTALLWKKPDFRRVNFLGLYFIAVHAAFSVEARYLAAIMPLLATVSAAAVFALAKENSSGEARKEGMFFFLAGSVPPVIISLFCIFLLLQRPGSLARPGSLSSVGEALARHPHDVWLLREYSRLQLLQGAYDAAYANLGKAAILSPEDRLIKIDLATAALLKNNKYGRPSAGADLMKKMFLHENEYTDPFDCKGYVLKALYELEAGREQEAAKSIRMAQLSRSAGIQVKLKSDNIDEEKLRSVDTAVRERTLPELLMYFPAGKKQKLCAGFLSLSEKKMSKSSRSLWCTNMLLIERTVWQELPFTPDDMTQASIKPGETDTSLRWKGNSDFFQCKTSNLCQIQIAKAVFLARRERKRVILEVGGDWCSWCKKMDIFYEHNPEAAAFRDRNFIVMKIFAGQNGSSPLDTSVYPLFDSLPHLYVLDSDDRLLRSQSTEGFETGEEYDLHKIRSFLRAWAPAPGL